MRVNLRFSSKISLLIAGKFQGVRRKNERCKNDKHHVSCLVIEKNRRLSRSQRDEIGQGESDRENT